MKTIAIIGPTASGKSALAVEAAQRLGAAVLSLDSLAIYREIDIVSAKPTPEERGGVPHYGIDVLAPDEPFNVTTFIDLYREAEARCRDEGRPLVIVGGTSFYLKALAEGISEIPEPSETTLRQVREAMLEPEKVHTLLSGADPATMRKIDRNDRYRLEKMLTLFLQTGMPPSEWFAGHPPKPVIEDFDLYEITVERSVLRQRIEKRTAGMIRNGLIDEVAGLERRYGRAPQSMKAIGIVETLDYLDGRISLQTLETSVATHTAQLAKRQQTFNRSQFPERFSAPAQQILHRILEKQSE